MTIHTKNRSQFVLIILFVLFLGPMLLALGVYRYPTLLNSIGGTSHSYGTLITPQPIDHLQLTTANNEPVYSDLIRSHWIMALNINNTCDGHCQKQLHDLRQIQLALGKDQLRVQLGLIAPHTQTPTVTKTVQNFWFKLGQSTELKKNAIYLIDPQGNVMMRYQDPADPAGILKDMERLLQVSQVG